MAIVDWALKYLETGFSVIPCIPPTKDEKGKDTKKPRIEWTQFQKRRASKDEVTDWWKKWPDSRVGIVTGAISDLFVVDCDSEDAHKTLEENHLPDSLITPKAKTPHGYHYYFKNQPELRNSVKIAGLGLDTRGEGGFVMAPPSRGLDANVYKWTASLEPWKIPRASLPESLLTLIKEYSIRWSMRGVVGGNNIEEKNTNFLYTRNTDSTQQQATEATTSNINNKNNRVNFTDGSRDESLFHLANCLRKGGMPIDEIEDILMLYAMKICEPPFPLKEAQVKVKSASERYERTERSLTSEIREFITQHRGNINATMCQQYATNATKQDYHKIHTILSRLAKEGILERTGRMAGEYRIVENDVNVVNASDIQIEKGIDISLPFMLEQYVEILPKDLIVIAGTPNSGKTALMLDMVAKNQDTWECWYFSTEMGQQACARRLAQRDPSLKWKFKFVQDFHSYEDVIKPDALNFIDYVEQNEGEAFKIPGILAKVQRKLRKGIAVVALQKNTGKGWGVGGEQTRAKPTLFLSVEQQYPGQILRIEKAKAFKDFNPNGWCMKFKIIKGINLRNETDWGPELAKADI